MRAILISLLLALPLHAQEVDLELVLLADASGSIDQSEIDLQRQGYAAAITHPDVVYAIQSTLTGTIAVTYVEWAANQVTVVDWTIIDGPETAAAFAAQLVPPPRLAYGRNAIGAALLEGRRLIDANEITGLRRVIDFSGDSINNWSGPGIAEARAEVLAANITINGLPILRPGDPGRSGSNLEAEYAERIIGGPGAFVVTADGRDSFARAVRRKLILEIAGLMPGDTLPRAPRPLPKG
ncbi:DUF1194 domain-containing protein [Paracoccaceae bacterium Fryx2]|nr:DUF1194 domain-containing protein [Paracoccaceae bacterium Fryx2]